MAKRLFLLDGMALVYRAHFAFVHRPILTSQGLNTSALYGFTQTLLDILTNQEPTHLAVVFDTAAPTARHTAFPEYKAQRQAMPEELSAALPHVRRMIEAFHIPVLRHDGFEADDIIGTLARRAEKAGFLTFMVTPDKDFGQLVDENTFIFKPGRAGDDAEILGPDGIKARWGIQRTEQVVDVLALMGDASDNIPGVPGIGEKTAIKLIAEFGTVENLLASTARLKGKLKESLETHRDLALLSKHLVTILHDAPCPEDLESLKLQPRNDQALQALLSEFEFNSIGRRLFGDHFKAGRGFSPASVNPPAHSASAPFQSTGAAPACLQDAQSDHSEQSDSVPPKKPVRPPEPFSSLPHEFEIASTPAARMRLLERLMKATSFGFKAAATGDDAKSAQLEGLAFSLSDRAGIFVPLPSDAREAAAVLGEFEPIFADEQIEKVGHELKFDLSLLKWRGLSVRGPLFDTLTAHSLIEPDQRHRLDYLTELYLGCSLMPSVQTQQEQLNLGEVASQKTADRTLEMAAAALQLRSILQPLLKDKGQDRLFYEIESPLIPVLVDMEHEGIRVDSKILAEFAGELFREMGAAEKAIWRLAGREFNVNSPRQLGEILFDELKVAAAPKKTKTGQYSTDEQTLLALAPESEIVQRLLEFRTAAKLKSTYADALPAAIWPATGRVHTTYNPVATTTGRLNSVNPNLQNIPIRTERGQEIRRAFLPRDRGFVLLSADYSQIELRIIAALSREPALLEAFHSGADVHVATAAKVYGVPSASVTPEMRRKAKMVNYGIAYGISAFGLAQRLGIPRKEGAEIIEQYYLQFQGIRQFMDETLTVARQRGYVETVTGRRRPVRDINSANGTVRAAAERNAINMPIQGTAADMIKLAMLRIDEELRRRRLRTKMLLQVHDELVFDLFESEATEVLPMVEEKMKTALPLAAPIEVELGTGQNWLAAH